MWDGLHVKDGLAVVDDEGERADLDCSEIIG